MPPTLLRPLIGRIERARRQNCGDGRLLLGTLKVWTEGSLSKKGASPKGLPVLTVGNT